MLNLFDFLIIGLFIMIIISLYGILKPENNKTVGFSDTRPAKRRVIKKIMKIKDKKALDAVIEQIAKEHIEHNVIALTKLDKEFEPQSFMENSKKIFENIVKSFETKDRLKLKSLVSEKVYGIFDDNIKQFEKNGQTLDTDIVRFKKIVITDVNVENKFAKIIVEFTTEQTTVLKDKSGKIIKGDDNHLETIKDVWIFTRDYHKRGSNWLLSETVEV